MSEEEYLVKLNESIEYLVSDIFNKKFTKTDAATKKESLRISGLFAVACNYIKKPNERRSIRASGVVCLMIIKKMFLESIMKDKTMIRHGTICNKINRSQTNVREAFIWLDMKKLILSTGHEAGRYKKFFTDTFRVSITDKGEEYLKCCIDVCQELILARDGLTEESVQLAQIG